LVEHAGEHLPPEVSWLLVMAIAVTLISIAILTNTIQLKRIHQQTHRIVRWLIVGAAVLILLLGFSNLEAIPLLNGLIFLLLAPVLVAFWVWLRVLNQEDLSAE
jgi:hypothetical protein